MGRELVRQLVAEPCNGAMCDVSAPGMAETQRLCQAAEQLPSNFGDPMGLQINGSVPSATCWDREFADSPLEGTGFEEGRSSSRRLRSGSRSARKGSRDRNGSKAWRLAA
jgi:hypothetical protein